MVKRRTAPSRSSFHTVGIDTTAMTIDNCTSMRSIESLSSNSSSLCSDDPAMRRTTPARRLGCKRHDTFQSQKRIINEAKEMNSDLRVTFSPTVSVVVCEVLSREDYTPEETKELFLTIGDMSQIKNDAKFVTKYFRVKEKCTVDALDEVYTNAICRSTSFATYEDFVRFLRNDDRELEKITEPMISWCRKAKVSGRGLERYCSQKQRSERQIFSAECRAAVVRLSKAGTVSDEDLSKFYHEYSRGNTIYARLMGHADEAAAACIFQSETVEISSTTRRSQRRLVRNESNRDLKETNLYRKEQLETSKMPVVMESNFLSREKDETPLVDLKRVELQRKGDNILSLDRRQIFAMQRQSSSAKLVVRLSNRSLETL
jgi:hypothetical protein